MNFEEVQFTVKNFSFFLLSGLCLLLLLFVVIFISVLSFVVVSPLWQWLITWIVAVIILFIVVVLLLFVTTFVVAAAVTVSYDIVVRVNLLDFLTFIDDFVVVAFCFVFWFFSSWRSCIRVEYRQFLKVLDFLSSRITIFLQKSICNWAKLGGPASDW